MAQKDFYMTTSIDDTQAYTKRQYKSISVSDLNTYNSARIPKYSQIDSAILYANVSTVLAATYIEYFGSSGDADSNARDTFYTSDSTKSATLNGNFTSRMNSKGANAGKYTGSYSSLYVRGDRSTVSREMKINTVKVYMKYTEPSAKVTPASNNTTMGTVSGGGTYTISKGSSYSCTITATAKTGYQFVKWSDGDTNASRTITVNEDYLDSFATSKTYTATFEAIKYYIDVNGRIDGTDKGNTSPAGTFDMYINGSRVKDNVNDFYAQYGYGSTYEIKDIQVADGYEYAGVVSGKISGTVTGKTSIRLAFNTKQETEIKKISFGSVVPSKIYFGSAEVQKIFIGSTQVWGKT